MTMTPTEQVETDELFARITHAQADDARARILRGTLDLIRAAHAAGWTYDLYGAPGDREHVWRAPYPHTEKVTVWRGVCEMYNAPGEPPRWSVRPESVREVADMLALVGLRAQMAEVS